MATNQRMMLKRAREWGKKVRVIGLNLDDDMAVAKTHVEKNKLNSVEHFWISDSKCRRIYGITAITGPCVMLIDQKGKIVFKGHPSTRNMEKDIDRLRKKLPIEGDGTWSLENPI